MKDIIEYIQKDLEVNKRCLQEKNIHPYCQELIEMWIRYDNKLLKMLGVK